MSRNNNIILTRTYETPVGIVSIGDFNGSLCMCDWIEAAGAPDELRKNIALRHERIRESVAKSLSSRLNHGDSPLLRAALAQLDDYFHGVRRDFDLPVLMTGTAFRIKVWNAIASIPYGETISYSRLAAEVGSPQGFRAVASACGANPISVIIPCHRVIGADGSLSGYAGGIAAKEFLLESEKHNFV